MIYENSDELTPDQIVGAGGKDKIPLPLMFEWMVLYFHLGMRNAVSKAIREWCKERGIVIKGSGIQKCTYLKTAYLERLGTGDPEMLAVFQDWNLDPTKKLEQQVPQLQREFVRRQAAEKAAQAAQARADAK